MQDTPKVDIRHTRVISWQNGAEEAQMYRVVHTCRPLYGAERGEALSHASTGKAKRMGGGEAHHASQKGLLLLSTGRTFRCLAREKSCHIHHFSSSWWRRLSQRISSSTVQHIRCSAPPRTAICRVMPQLWYSCSLSVHADMHQACHQTAHDAQKSSVKVLSRPSRWRSFKACRAQNWISNAVHRLTYST